MLVEWRQLGHSIVVAVTSQWHRLFSAVVAVTSQWHRLFSAYVSANVGHFQHISWCFRDSLSVLS